MNILIVSLLKRRIDQKITASRPRIIYELVKGLLKRGHKVTVLGTKDSYIPGAKIIPIIPKSFANMPAFENPFYAETSYLVRLAKKIEKIAGKFDIIHNNTYPEFINLMVIDKIKPPMITTIHAQATPELDAVLGLFPKAYLISISNAHRKLFKKAKIYKVVYNGIDTDLYSFMPKKEDYLLWIGRLGKAKNKDGTFMDAKGIKWAIKLSRSTSQKLLLSGNIEDREFFEKDVRPFLNKKIRWIGQISSEQPLSKKEVAGLMQKAKAFLMPINWYEPFGLVIAEAMSCGTPVIGFNKGSVPELVVNGKTGFVVPYKKGIKGLAEALKKINTIKPEDCRKHVEKNFSVERMIENYENLYKDLIKRNRNSKVTN